MTGEPAHTASKERMAPASKRENLHDYDEGLQNNNKQTVCESLDKHATTYQIHTVAMAKKGAPCKKDNNKTKNCTKKAL